MQTIEVYTPNRDAAGKFLGLGHETVFNDPEALDRAAADGVEAHAEGRRRPCFRPRRRTERRDDEAQQATLSKAASRLRC